MAKQKTACVTVSIMDSDGVNSEYEFSNDNFHKLGKFLSNQKGKGIKTFAWEGNMYSIEYTDKKPILQFKKLMQSLSKDKPKGDKVGIEWGYWQYHED